MRHGNTEETSTMAKEPATPTTQVAFRLPDTLLDRLDLAIRR